MNATDRRMEIVSILGVSGHVTIRELVKEFGVCMSTIRNNISYISYGYSIYTKPGLAGEFYHGCVQTVQQYSHALRARKTQRNV